MVALVLIGVGIVIMVALILLLRKRAKTDISLQTKPRYDTTIPPVVEANLSYGTLTRSVSSDQLYATITDIKVEHTPEQDDSDYVIPYI